MGQSVGTAKTAAQLVLDGRARRSDAVIAGLTALSGACGLAYEILYIRIFTNYFGDSFILTGVTLSAVFLGLAFGAWMSGRFLRWLGLIEITIGLYAFATAWGLSTWGFEIAAWGGTPALNSVKLGMLLGTPAFLIGTCVPLFAAYARGAGPDTPPAFTRIYGLYNFGAFLSVLAIEFVLFRSFGLKATLSIIGTLNLIVGTCLLLQGHHRIASRAEPQAARLDRRIALALFMGSFASGVFQLWMLRLSFAIFGPLNENFAILLAAAILGVALGTVLAARGTLRLEETLTGLALAVLVIVIAVPGMITLWSRAAGGDLSDGSEVLIKVLLLGGLPLPAFVLLGALVPLAVSAQGNETTPQAGRLLALSSLGNGLGGLTMFLALYRLLDLTTIAIACFALLTGAALVVQGGNIRPLARLYGGVIAASLIFAGQQSWPRIELLLGYRTLMHEEEISWRKRSFEDAVVYKAYDQNATLARFADGGSALVLNGYRSLSFGPGSKAELHEVIVGATPALFGARTDRALVFGLGSGITGGATARLYAQTKIVEINPAMLSMPQHFEGENHRVMTRPGVEVALEDGISTLLREPQLYDAIVNTVTSPQYYSAAKLYTRDFYGIVKSRLAVGGVYSSWFDVNIDREGIAIMLNTLEASFAHCRYFLLTGGYFNAVCSDAPLLYLPGETVAGHLAGSSIDALFARYGFEGGLRTTMAALELDFAPRFFARETDILNTLDHPAIEFVVARERDASETMTRLGEMIAANIEFQRQTGFGSDAWRSNCRALSQMSGLAFSGC